MLRDVELLPPPTLRDMANPTWEQACARILLVRLSPWSDVDSSSSHLIIFSETRQSLPNAYIDFAFLPSGPDRKALSESGRPWFFGSASGRSVADFDLVMVSNACALELLNLPYLFSSAGLPVFASERASMEDCPLVILGGSNAACTGSLVKKNPRLTGGVESIPDGIFFGEGEGSIGPLAALLCGLAEETVVRSAPQESVQAPPLRAPSRPSMQQREERLAAAACIEGFWPCRQRSAARRHYLRQAPSPLVAYPLLQGPSVNTARLAITAGCPGFCSFCLEGWDRRPYREVPLSSIVEAARQLKINTGADSIDVYSFNFNTHIDIESLVFELNRIFYRVSFMSQRLDILARKKGLAALEMAGGKKNFTLGIEGISSRMRAYYRKGLSLEDLQRCMEILVRPGVKEIKLFYIISGMEHDDDLAEFSDFIADLQRWRASLAPGLRIIASAGFLVRLPFTPLQFAPIIMDKTLLESISSRMGAICAAANIEYRQAASYDEFCVDQYLAMDNGHLMRWLASMPEKGFVYDGSLPRGLWPSLRHYCNTHALPSNDFLTEKPESWRPPLSFIEDEAHHAVLRRRYEDAVRYNDPCAMAAAQPASPAAAAPKKMRSAGALAGTDSGALAGTDPRVAPVLQHIIERTARLIQAKASFPCVDATIVIPQELSGAGPEYRAAWLLKTIFNTIPDSDRLIFSAEEIVFSKGQPYASLVARSGWKQYGYSRFAFLGPDQARMQALLERMGATEIIKRAAAAHPCLPETWKRRRVALYIDRAYADAALDAFGKWLHTTGNTHIKYVRPESTIFEATSATVKKKLFYKAVFFSPDRATAGSVKSLQLPAPENLIMAHLDLGEKAPLGEWLTYIGQEREDLRSLRIL